MLAFLTSQTWPVLAQTVQPSNVRVLNLATNDLVADPTSTNSISFNGPAPTSASVAFVSPSRLVQLDAYNGGTTSSGITLTCAGQPPVQRSLAAGQSATIVTKWTGSCSSLTVTSSNGWSTNFDNLLVAR